jgi:hypothetical protein
MLNHSLKYMRLFEKAQEGSADVFTRAVKNFSFAAQRFDSLSVPLLKIFSLLPVVYKFLRSLTSDGDQEDQAWACNMLSRLTGVGAFHDIMCCALAADACLVGHNMIRLDDTAENNSILKASEAFFLT